MTTILGAAEFNLLLTNVAYKAGMSVQDVIRSLLNNLNIAKKRHLQYFAYLLDFSSAFDSISHTYIYEALAFIGFPDEFIDQDGPKKMYDKAGLNSYQIFKKILDTLFQKETIRVVKN